MLPSKSQQSVTELVGSLYDCIPDDTRWAGFVEIIAFLKSIAYRCQIIPQTGLLSLPLITAVPDH